MPYQSAFGITELGLTAGNIAACYTAVQVTVFVLKPSIGYIADYFNRLKAIIVGLAVLQVVFCFFMIIIPNTGMPGIDSIQLTNTSQNYTYCQLCFNSGIFEQHSAKRYLNEENFRHVSFCFNSNVVENILINCPSYTKSNYSNNYRFEIKRTLCNSFDTDRLFPENDTTLEGAYSNADSVDILYMKTSHIFSICVLPIGRQIYNMNFSSDDLNKYCYALLNESAMQLQHLLAKSDCKTIDCNYLYKQQISSQQKDESGISMANFKTYQFWAFAICLLIATTCFSAEFTVSDTACYESIQGNDYGQQKFWGPLGWGFMAPFAGYLNDYTENYLASWCLFAFITALQMWNLSRMNLIKPAFSQNILKDMKTVFSSAEFLCFEAGVLLNGMFTGIIWYYLIWFIISIGGNKLVIGLAQTIQNLFGEVPAFYFSGWLIEKIGHFNLVSLALICHGVRFFFYSYLHNPWWILPIECLQAFTYGSFYAAMTSYGKLNAKPGTEATTQSILSITFEALGK